MTAAPVTSQTLEFLTFVLISKHIVSHSFIFQNLLQTMLLQDLIEYFGLVISTSELGNQGKKWIKLLQIIRFRKGRSLL